MVNVVPVDCTKLSANPRLSWVPTPTTVSLSELFRANCSTPGASRRQMVQWGAQNQRTRGWSAGAKLARFTVAPVATSTNSTDGRSDAGAGAAVSVAISGAGARVAGASVETGTPMGAASGPSLLSAQAAAPRAKQEARARTLIFDFMVALTSGCSSTRHLVQDPAMRWAGPLVDFLAEPVEDDDPVLASDSQSVPGGTGRIPEHQERISRSSDSNEVLGLTQVVSGTHTDHGELVSVVSSELLEAGGFPAAGGSMGGPEPQHDGPVRGGEAGQVDGGPGGHVHHLHRRQV